MFDIRDMFTVKPFTLLHGVILRVLSDLVLALINFDVGAFSLQ